MKKLLFLSALSLYAGSAFAVLDGVSVTCTPPATQPAAPTYVITEADGGAPGYPVAWLSVTKKQPGFADVSAQIDLLKTQHSLVMPFKDGSALLFSFTTQTYDSNTHQFINPGYISIYERDQVGYSVVDVQLPQNLPNAAALNTNPPLVDYSCVTSSRF